MATSGKTSSVYLMHPRFLLPLMIVIGVIVVGLRLEGVWASLSEGKIFAPVQQVQAAAVDKETQSTTKPEEKKEPAKVEETASDKPSGPAAPSKEVSSPEGDLYKQLAGRRDQLDRREQEMTSREALLKIAEQRMDQKLKEMETLKTQLQALVGQAGSAQQAQLDNLVKIYEIMKPKEAAKIFETLEMPVLLGVVQKMKPARTAAVMAEMNPEKAKEVTVALTKQDQLPQIK